MPNLINLFGEAGANMIGDDAEPTFALSNSSTGPGLRALGVVVQSTASIDVANVPTITGAASASPVTTIGRTVLASPTVATLQLSANSSASTPVLEFIEKGFVSITSTVLTTVANTDYAIRVKVGDTYRWIPLFADAALVGTAAF